jgi:hypothetical protein
MIRPPRQIPPEQIQTTAKKPVFHTGTWITVIVFAALLGLALYLRNRPQAPETEATPSTAVTYVFTSEDGLPTSIEVKPLDGEPVLLARNEEEVWALELPEKMEADQGFAEAAASQVTSLRILDQVDLAPDILGLENPAYVITIKFTGGSEHALEVGDTTPTNNGYYVRVDEGQPVIVALSGLESLLNLATSPPYLNTPTPSPQPATETPLAPVGTSAPEIVVTPTP